MTKTRRQWKAYAREMLRGNYTIPIVGTLAIAGINFVGGNLGSSLFRGSSLTTIIISQIFMFILSLIMCVFTAGLSYMYMNIARGRKYSLGDILFLFKNHPDRVIVAGFVLALIDVVVNIPYFYVSYTKDPGVTAEENAEWLLVLSFYLLLGIVLNLLLTLPFVMTYFLLADDLELGGIDALKASLGMMKGNKGKYLLLQLSFIPLLFLSAFTLYIGLLWLLPYMEMSSVMFYRDLCGEFDLGAQQPPVQGTEMNGQGPQDYWNRVGDDRPGGDRPGDDYNSEA
ncbi:DUF975 family protein [Blautia schinkii]|nr:DUF975 family protein [Blautia schinkii]